MTIPCYDSAYLENERSVHGLDQRANSRITLIAGLELRANYRSLGQGFHDKRYFQLLDRRQVFLEDIHVHQVVRLLGNETHRLTKQYHGRVMLSRHKSKRNAQGFNRSVRVAWILFDDDGDPFSHRS